LITGASGFIGSHLAEELVKRAGSVRCLVHYNGRNDWGNLEFLSDDKKDHLDVMLGDIQDPFFVHKVTAGCDVVFHLASLIAIPYSYIAPQSYISTNVMGTLNVMQACLEHQVAKVIHTSTSEVYGTAMYTPIDEKHPLQGQSPYSASKIGADKVAESFYCSFQLPVATLRPFNTFGPRQSARAVVPAIITQALHEKQVALGSLAPIRDLTYVTDTVSGFIKIAECDASVGTEIHIGNNQGISVGDLARLILKIIGKDLPIVLDEARIRPENSEVLQLICNYDKSKSLFGWEPAVSLKEGLLMTINHLKDQMSRYKTDRYTI